MTPRFADSDDPAVPIHLVASDALDDRLAALEGGAADWARACGFEGRVGEVLRVPGDGMAVGAVLVGWGTADDHRRGRFRLAAAAKALGSGA